MQSEMIRFRSDVAVNPAIIGMCLDDDFSIDALVGGARRRGYEFDIDDVEQYYAAEKETDRLARPCSYQLVDEAGQSRELTPVEFNLVGGGEYVYVATYANVYVYISAAVYTVTAAATWSVVASTTGAVVLALILAVVA